MKPIDESKIHKYEASSPNAKRVYDWMLNYHLQNYEKLGLVMFTRDQLINLFGTAGIKRQQAIDALREIEMVCGTIAFWDSDARTMKYCVLPMTPEEKIKQIQLDVDFERL